MKIWSWTEKKNIIIKVWEDRYTQSNIIAACNYLKRHSKKSEGENNKNDVFKKPAILFSSANLNNNGNFEIIDLLLATIEEVSKPEYLLSFQQSICNMIDYRNILGQ